MFTFGPKEVVGVPGLGRAFPQRRSGGNLDSKNCSAAPKERATCRLVSMWKNSGRRGSACYFEIGWSMRQSAEFPRGRAAEGAQPQTEYEWTFTGPILACCDPGRFGPLSRFIKIRQLPPFWI